MTDHTHLEAIVPYGDRTVHIVRGNLAPDSGTMEAQMRGLARLGLQVSVSADFRHPTWPEHITYQTKPTSHDTADRDAAYKSGLRTFLAQADPSFHRHLVDPETEAIESGSECYVIDDKGAREVTPAEFYAGGDAEEHLIYSYDSPALSVVRTDIGPA